MLKFVCIETHRDGTQKAQFSNGQNHQSATEKELRSAIEYRQEMNMPTAEIEIALSELTNKRPLSDQEKTDA